MITKAHSKQRLPSSLEFYINKDLFTEYTFRTIVSEVIVLTAIKYQLRYDVKSKIKDEPLRNWKTLLRQSVLNVT